MQNDTDTTLILIFDHSLSVLFMTVKTFVIDSMNLDWKVKDENKWWQSIMYYILINKY